MSHNLAALMRLVGEYGQERQTGQEMPNDQNIERTYVAVREYAKKLCASPVQVVVERGRVWIVRGDQSFMLAYHDTDVEGLNWYANKLRKALGARK